MRSVSHTLIGILSTEISDYRRVHRKSRETIGQEIVEAHERLGADIITGIRFEPKTVDAFERSKVNADRIFRWLDDVTKDTNQLPANFLLSVLAALPEDVQRRILDRLLLPLGLAVRARALPEPAAPFTTAMVTRLMREQNESTMSATALLDGYTPQELEHTHQQVSEAIDAGRQFRAIVEAHMSELEVAK